MTPEEQIDYLTKRIAIQEESLSLDRKHIADLKIELIALREVVKTMAYRMGATPKSFDSHYAAWRSRRLDQHLESVSLHSEELAAHLDDRSLDEVDTGESIPPLIPD